MSTLAEIAQKVTSRTWSARSKVQASISTVEPLPLMSTSTSSATLTSQLQKIFEECAGTTDKSRSSTMTMPFADRPARSDDWDEGYNLAISEAISMLNDFIDDDAPEGVKAASSAHKAQIVLEGMRRVKPAALKTTPQPAPEVEFGGAKIAWDEAIPQGQVFACGARGGGKTETTGLEMRGMLGKIERSGDDYVKAIKGKISKHDRKNKP